MQIPDGNTTGYFLTTFGRATLETVCSCEVKMEPNLSQALNLLNGTTAEGKIKEGELVKALLKSGTKREAVLDDHYLRALGRKPTDAERTKLVSFFGDPKTDEQVLNDIFWVLLIAKEFVFNH